MALLSRLSLALLAALWATPAAHAVVLMDTVWLDQGGSAADWGAGFGPNVDLANEPQFDAVIGFEGQFKDDYHFGCTGTWLGNDANEHAFVLTAAHCLTPDIDMNSWTYFSLGGTDRAAVAVTLHPLYDPDLDETSGYDLAIIELDGPFHDAGEPPVLYAGSDEAGHVGTLVGYGTRGTAEHGEDRKFNADSDKAAARNLIDLALDYTGEADSTNVLQFDFDSPDGENNTLEGDAFPLDDFEGMPGTGDSGGPLWIETDNGWRLAGITSTTDIMQGYGMIADYARVSTQLDWILSLFPDAAYDQ